jgi:hypothetical protein
MLVAGFAVGFETGGLIGGLLELLVAAIVGAALPGDFLVLDDIRKRLHALE